MPEQAEDKGSQGTVGTSTQTSTPKPGEQPGTTAPKTPDLFGLGYGKGIGVGTEQGEQKILAALKPHFPDISSKNLQELLAKHFQAKPKDETGKDDEQKAKVDKEKDALIHDLKAKVEQIERDYKEKYDRDIKDRELLNAAVAADTFDAKDAAILFDAAHKIDVGADLTLKVSTLDGKPLIHRDGDKVGDEMSIADAMKAWLLKTKPHLLKASATVTTGAGATGSETEGTTKTYTRDQIPKDPIKYRQQREDILKAEQAGKIK